jgi:hypothetical protein
MTYIHSRQWRNIKKITGIFTKKKKYRDLNNPEIVENFVDKRLRVPDVAIKDARREMLGKWGSPAVENHRFNHFGGFRGVVITLRSHKKISANRL